MKAPKRSGCPISFALDVLGDKWTLLVLRDLVFRSARHFQDFIDSSEGIASNVLAERLSRLETYGIVTKTRDTEDRRRYIYGLTPAGLDLIPVLIDLTVWGSKHDPESTFPRSLLEPMERDREGAIRCYRERAGPP